MIHLQNKLSKPLIILGQDEIDTFRNPIKACNGYDGVTKFLKDAGKLAKSSADAQNIDIIIDGIKKQLMQSIEQRIKRNRINDSVNTE